eukprot:3803679-Rhodomonas_salina.4
MSRARGSWRSSPRQRRCVCENEGMLAGKCVVGCCCGEGVMRVLVGGVPVRSCVVWSCWRG